MKKQSSNGIFLMKMLHKLQIIQKTLWRSLEVNKFTTIVVLSIVSITSYAALNIPMPQAPGASLGNGLRSGSDFYNQIQNQNMARAQNQRANELHQLQIEMMREQLRQLKNKRTG